MEAEERLGCSLALNPDPGRLTLGRELKTRSSSLRSQGLELHSQCPQLLISVPEREAPKTSSFENQQGLELTSPTGGRDLRTGGPRTHWLQLAQQHWT